MQQTTPAANLSARQRDILRAVLEIYVETGEPVASQPVAASLGVSSATVRSAMAELDEAGFLEQPHTSAGRVPTARAFRMHVEQLRSEGSAAMTALPATARIQIDAQLSGLAGADAFLERTSHVLATISSGVGLALAHPDGRDLLEHVHFQRLAARKVLAVVVTRAGAVRDRVLHLDVDPAMTELEAAARYLNENFRGWTIERVRAELARRTEHERNEYRRMVQSAGELWALTVAAQGSPAQTVYVEGVANLVGGENDRTRLREMLTALEAKERIITLLHAWMSAHQEGISRGSTEAGSVRVVFDLEQQAPEMQGLVLIAAPAMLDGAQIGTLGVLGMQRMHYQNTISTVRYVAQLFTQLQQAGSGA